MSIDFNVLTGKTAEAAKLIPLSARPSTLKGKTIALYHNDKVCSFPMMRTIKKLVERLGAKAFEVHTKAPYSRHPDRAIKEALKADAVFAGTADWGSCTAWVTDAAVRIEKGGKPVVVLAAHGFEKELANHGAVHGLPYLTYVVIDFHQTYLAAIPQQTEKSFDKMVKALTTPAKELMKNIPGEVK